MARFAASEPLGHIATAMAGADDPTKDKLVFEEGTLGALLYADQTRARVAEAEWVVLVRRIALGDQLALHTLYQRLHRIVFTLCVRITGRRELAEEVTIDVFHEVWRRASTYDSSAGPVVGWVMNQARSRAIDRVRFERRKKRVNERSESAGPPAPAGGPHEELRASEQRRVLRDALAVLNDAERRAIETAFFSELTYPEVAARLNEPLGTIKTRVRSGLEKLRQKLAGEGEEP